MLDELMTRIMDATKSGDYKPLEDAVRVTDDYVLANKPMMRQATFVAYAICTNLDNRDKRELDNKAMAFLMGLMFVLANTEGANDGS